jgi:uncharacterized HAD superfamily protein|tara:strand:- start:1126 stop:1248 length:123 start_codon:yes stop_codon:yes gene_type:complete
MGLYTLGDRLKMPIHKLVEMPVEEFNGWVAYYRNKENGDK